MLILLYYQILCKYNVNKRINNHYCHIQAADLQKGIFVQMCGPTVVGYVKALQLSLLKSQS